MPAIQIKVSFFPLYKVACVFNARINPQSNRPCNLKGLVGFWKQAKYFFFFFEAGGHGRVQC